MNKILACFLLIAVLASAQCSIWDSVKGWVKKGVNIVTTKAAEYAYKWANDFVAKYPMFKDIYKQLINLGEGAAYKACTSLNYGEIYCLNLINDIKKQYIKV